MERSFQQQGAEFYAGHVQNDLESLVQERFFSNSAEVTRTRELIDMVPVSTTSLLDVGAGFGVFLDAVRQAREINVEGVDITESYLKWGLDRGLKMSVASAHDLPQANRSVDIVTATEVLEHLQWGVYETALLELQRVADEWILISVPYDERRYFVTCPYCSSKSNPDYHHRSFDVDRLYSLFADFELQEVRFIEKLSVLTMLKPYLRAPWPSHMLCPACHYRKSDSTTAQRDQSFAKFKAFLRALPLPRRPRWLAALYRRR